MFKAAMGEKDSKLEFYVTVEYFKDKKHASNNVDVNNPYPAVPVNPPKKIEPKKTEPKKTPVAKGSPAESKGNSQKKEKGITDVISEKWDELWDWWESRGTVKNDQLPTRTVPDGRSPAIVKAQPKQEKKENKEICEYEARVRAFMRMLRVKEGTSGESGYTKLFGHSNFTTPLIIGI